MVTCEIKLLPNVIANSVGCFQRRLFVSTITSERETGWSNLRDRSRCIVQKSRPSSNLAAIASLSLGAHPRKCGVGLRRWEQEALLLQRNRATRYVSWNIMAVFWLSYWQEALLIQRSHASTLSVEIVYNAAQMFDGLHVKTSATGEWPSRSFKVTAVATIW